jgi:hypothetical protein
MLLLLPATHCAAHRADPYRRMALPKPLPHCLLCCSCLLVPAAFLQCLTQQVCYAESILFTDMAFLVRNTDPDAGFSSPGYILYMNNTTQVCDNYITEDCYSTLGQDACIAELLNNLLNGTQAGFEWTPGAIAGVAAAGVCSKPSSSLVCQLAPTCRVV